jgi:hypothetical protein
LTSLAALVVGQSPVAAGALLLRASPHNANFGAIPVGGFSDPLTIIFTNNNAGAVIVENYLVDFGGQFDMPDNNCVTASLIPSGSSCTATFEFDPTSTGRKTGTLTLMSGGIAVGKVALSGRGVSP